jgi:hypothetical protein
MTPLYLIAAASDCHDAWSRHREARDALTGFVTYDKRLRDAAVHANLPVMTPGSS